MREKVIMEHRIERKKEKSAGKTLLLVVRIAWLGVSALAELILAFVCIGGFILFRAWNDKLMILAFCLMFLVWMVVSLGAIVRAVREYHWVICTQLWMKLVLFIGTMTIFYLLAPVYQGAFWMGVLTVFVVIVTLFLAKEAKDNAKPRITFSSMPSYRYETADRTDWQSAYFLCLAEKSLLSKAFLNQKMNPEILSGVQNRRIFPNAMINSSGGCVLREDFASEEVYYFTLYYYCFGYLPESVTLHEYIGSYEEDLEQVLAKAGLSADSPFDFEVYSELFEKISRAYEVFLISREIVSGYDVQKMKPLRPTRVMKRGDAEISVYAHHLVADDYLRACLEDFDQLPSKTLRDFSKVERIFIYPPHGTSRVFVILGENAERQESNLELIIQDGKPLTGEDEQEILAAGLSPWVLLRKREYAEENA